MGRWQQHSRQRLRSSATHKLIVPRTRCRNVGDRAFGVTVSLQLVYGTICHLPSVLRLIWTPSRSISRPIGSIRKLERTAQAHLMIPLFACKAPWVRATEHMSAEMRTKFSQFKINAKQTKPRQLWRSINDLLGRGRVPPRDRTWMDADDSFIVTSTTRSPFVLPPSFSTTYAVRIHSVPDCINSRSVSCDRELPADGLRCQLYEDDTQIFGAHWVHRRRVDMNARQRDSSWIQRRPRCSCSGPPPVDRFIRLRSYRYQCSWTRSCPQWLFATRLSSSTRIVGATPSEFRGTSFAASASSV